MAGPPSSWIGVEVFIFFGIVLAAAGWELWSLRRDRRADRNRHADADADADTHATEGKP